VGDRREARTAQTSRSQSRPVPSGSPSKLRVAGSSPVSRSLLAGIFQCSGMPGPEPFTTLLRRRTQESVTRSPQRGPSTRRRGCPSDLDAVPHPSSEGCWTDAEEDAERPAGAAQVLELAEVAAGRLRPTERGARLGVRSLQLEAGEHPRGGPDGREGPKGAGPPAGRARPWLVPVARRVDRAADVKAAAPMSDRSHRGGARFALGELPSAAGESLGRSAGGRARIGRSAAS